MSSWLDTVSQHQLPKGSLSPTAQKLGRATCIMHPLLVHVARSPQSAPEAIGLGLHCSSVACRCCRRRFGFVLHTVPPQGLKAPEQVAASSAWMTWVRLV